MACPHKHSEEERAEGCKEGYLSGMPAQQAFGNLYEPVHSARSMHHSRTRDGSNDDVDDIGRRIAGLEAETEDKYGKGNAGNGTQCQAAIARTYIEGSKDDDELNEEHGLSDAPMAR